MRREAECSTARTRRRGSNLKRCTAPGRRRLGICSQGLTRGFYSVGGSTVLRTRRGVRGDLVGPREPTRTPQKTTRHGRGRNASDPANCGLGPPRSSTALSPRPILTPKHLSTLRRRSSGTGRNQTGNLAAVQGWNGEKGDDAMSAHAEPMKASPDLAARGHRCRPRKN